MEEAKVIAVEARQARLWADAELHPVSFSIRALSVKEAGLAVDRTAYLRLIIEHGEYFQDNDMWGLPTRETDLVCWMDGNSRVLAGAFDETGDCVGFCGADRDLGTFRGMNLWYGVAPRAQGRGLARELAHETLWMFKNRFPTTKHVALGCRDTNAASQAVAIALGMTRNSGDDYRRALCSAAPVCNYLMFGSSVADIQQARLDSTKPNQFAWHVTAASNLQSILDRGLVQATPEPDGDLAVSLFKTRVDAERETEAWLAEKLDYAPLVILKVDIDGLALTETFPFEWITTGTEPIEPSRIKEVQHFQLPPAPKHHPRQRA